MNKKYLLSGRIKCGKCGATVIAKTRKRGDKYYHYYMCNTYNLKGKSFCDQNGIKAEDLEDNITDLFINHLKKFESISTLKDCLGIIEAEVEDRLSKIERLESALLEIVGSTKNNSLGLLPKTIDELKAQIIRIENLKVKENFFKSYKYKNNIIKELIEDRDIIKENLDIFVKEITIKDQEITIVFY